MMPDSRYSLCSSNCKYHETLTVILILAMSTGSGQPLIMSCKPVCQRDDHILAFPPQVLRIHLLALFCLSHRAIISSGCEIYVM
ncbi:hypothetical protein BD769DRAFT_1436419 [Suillus cothurnatus]|nr:hypothetical protein BD769DRAFT_1436419 [Suillus cothurnatus]